MNKSFIQLSSDLKPEFSFIKKLSSTSRKKKKFKIEIHSQNSTKQFIYTTYDRTIINIAFKFVHSPQEVLLVLFYIKSKKKSKTFFLFVLILNKQKTKKLHNCNV